MGAGHDHGISEIKHEKPLWWARSDRRNCVTSAKPATQLKARQICLMYLARSTAIVAGCDA